MKVTYWKRGEAGISPFDAVSRCLDHVALRRFTLLGKCDFTLTSPPTVSMIKAVKTTGRLAMMLCCGVVVMSCGTPAAQSMRDLEEGIKPLKLTPGQHESRFFQLAADFSLRENNRTLEGFCKKAELKKASFYDIDYALRTGCDGRIQGESGIAPSEYLDFQSMLINQLVICKNCLPQKQSPEGASVVSNLVEESILRYGCCAWVMKAAKLDNGLTSYRDLKLIDAHRLHFSHYLYLLLVKEDMRE